MKKKITQTALEIAGVLNGISLERDLVVNVLMDAIINFNSELLKQLMCRRSNSFLNR